MLAASFLLTYVSYLSVPYSSTETTAIVRISLLYRRPLLPDSRVRPSVLAASYGEPLEGVYPNPLLCRGSYSARSFIVLVGYSRVRGRRWLSPFQLMSRL